MRISRTVAILLTGVLGAGFLVQPASATAPARNTFGAQCSYDSGMVRAWWSERGRGELLGDVTGGATDGRCATVPASVPWFAQQVDGLLKTFRSAGFPLPKSDAGIQRITPKFNDDGSGAYDVLLDGEGSDYALAEAGCSAVTYYAGGGRKYRTVAKMTVHGVSAVIPENDHAALMRMALAHELVHFTQCAVTNNSRSMSGSNLSGPWVEAVPQAIGLGLVGGSWRVSPCSKSSHLLSATADDSSGYGQWPFWQALLGTSGSSYAAMLRDVIRVPRTRWTTQLEHALRARFNATQISRALIDWMTSAYLGGPKQSVAGTPATWTPLDLTDSMDFLVDEATGSETPEVRDPLVGVLSPSAGGSVSSPVTVAPLTCAALLVPWPDGAHTLTVSASGLPGAVADSMAAGLDVAPGLTADMPCGSASARTRVPPTGDRFVVARPCLTRGSVAPALWVFLANGAATPSHLTVSATAS